MWSLPWPKNTQNAPRGLEVTQQLCLGQQGKLRRECGVIVSAVCQVFLAWLSRHVVGLRFPGLCFSAPCWLGEAMSLVLANGCERKWCGSLLGGGIHCWWEIPPPRALSFPLMVTGNVQDGGSFLSLGPRVTMIKGALAAYSRCAVHEREINFWFWSTDVGIAFSYSIT